MVFEATLFLAGAVLFFLSVFFFVFLWQDRMALARRSEALQVEVTDLKEHRGNSCKSFDARNSCPLFSNSLASLIRVCQNLISPNRMLDV